MYRNYLPKRTKMVNRLKKKVKIHLTQIHHGYNFCPICIYINIKIIIKMI